jgi:hypothetical protein
VGRALREKLIDTIAPMNKLSKFRFSHEWNHLQKDLLILNLTTRFKFSTRKVLNLVTSLHIHLKARYWSVDVHSSQVDMYIRLELFQDS